MSLFAGMIKLCEESDEVKRLIESLKEHADELNFDAVDMRQMFPADQLARASPLFMELVHEADPRNGMTEFQASYAVVEVMKNTTCHGKNGVKQ